MDNINHPAYPTGQNQSGTGFTKLELASLMIAQGLCADPSMDSTNVIPEMAVKIAKAVLEEANK